MSTKLLHTHDGNEVETYVVGPDTARHAVLIIHDWWGVLTYNQQWADRLAELGYKVMVIDLYDGEKASNAEQAGELMRNLDQDLADSKLLAALEYLKQGERKVSCLGWSLGGRQALLTALLDPETVNSTVLFYCRLQNDVEALRTLGGPVLAIYAEQETTWPEKMEKFNKAMAAAGKEVESHTFDAKHGFVNPGSERYNEAFTEKSWQLVKDFLQRVAPV
ncbi:MAG: dienelactone hydrolase family protein [Thiohalomonadaceae bacterium]